MAKKDTGEGEFTAWQKKVNADQLASEARLKARRADPFKGRNHDHDPRDKDKPYYA